MNAKQNFTTERTPHSVNVDPSFQMRIQSVAGPDEARAAADEAVQGGQGGRAPLRHGQGPSRGHDVQVAEGPQGDCQLQK